MISLMGRERLGINYNECICSIPLESNTGSAVYLLTLFFLNSPVDLLTEVTSDCKCMVPSKPSIALPQLISPIQYSCGVYLCADLFVWVCMTCRGQGRTLSVMYSLPYSLGRSLTEPEAHWLGWQARELLGSARLWPAVLSAGPGLAFLRGYWE